MTRPYRVVALPPLVAGPSVGAISYFTCRNHRSSLSIISTSGLPVVSTRLAGVPEMVEEGVTGFLVESADVAALAGALHKTLLDMNLARTLGQAGHRAAHEKFSIATSARALRSLFAETMP